MDDWRSRVEGRVDAETFARISNMAEAVAEQKERLRKAREALKAVMVKRGIARLPPKGDGVDPHGRRLPPRPSFGAEIEDAEEEVEAAIDALAVKRRELTEAVLAALAIEPDVIVEDDTVYQTSHEKLRKERIEKELGRELGWDEYFAYLEEVVYPEREEEEAEYYDICVRSYGWQFDASRDDGKFPSDLGMHDWSKTVRTTEESARNREARKRQRPTTKK